MGGRMLTYHTQVTINITRLLLHKCKAMVMGTRSVTHREKNECYREPVPMLPTGSPVEWGPMYKIAWLELIHLKSYKQINLPSSILFCS